MFCRVVSWRMAESQAYLISTAEPGSNEPDSAFAERTIYIPLPQAGGDFIVHLDRPIADEKFQVSARAGNVHWANECELNRVCQLEGVAFALKRTDDSWSDEVNIGVLPAAPPTFAASPVQSAPNAPTANPPAPVAAKGAVATPTAS